MMMITISAILIPCVIAIILSLFVVDSVNRGTKGGWGGVFACFLAGITFLSIPLVWTLYFAVLAF
jgi:hypothetical protein